MADRKAQLQAALEQAHASGDMEAAKRLATAIAAETTVAGSTATAPRNVPASFGRGGIVPGPAGEPARQENIQFARSVAKAPAEAGRAMVGGARQAAGALSDAFDLFVHGTPYRGPDVKLPDGAIIRGGELETSRHNKATATEILRQVNQKQDWIEQGIDPDVASRTAKGLELGGLAIAPEFVGPRATTMVGAGISNIIRGSASTAMEFDADGNIISPIACKDK